MCIIVLQLLVTLGSKSGKAMASPALQYILTMHIYSLCNNYFAHDPACPIITYTQSFSRQFAKKKAMQYKKSMQSDGEH